MCSVHYLGRYVLFSLSRNSDVYFGLCWRCVLSFKISLASVSLSIDKQNIAHFIVAWHHREILSRCSLPTCQSFLLCILARNWVLGFLWCYNIYHCWISCLNELTSFWYELFLICFSFHFAYDFLISFYSHMERWFSWGINACEPWNGREYGDYC